MALTTDWNLGSTHGEVFWLVGVPKMSKNAEKKRFHFKTVDCMTASSKYRDSVKKDFLVISVANEKQVKNQLETP